jgi:DNA repair protein RecO (recombination protein O)
MHAHLRPGRGELAHLERVTVDRSFPNILRNLGTIAAAGAGLAVIRERVPDHEPEPAVFDIAERFLAVLDEGAPAEEALLALHIQVLGLLGFAPTLDRCVHCGKSVPSGRSASFDAARGGIVCRACGGGSLVLSANALHRWAAVQAATELPDRPWSSKERGEIEKALALLDANHATASVRERTSSAKSEWGGSL